jgi:cytochrome c oxidase assembly protein subunit 11
MDKNQKTLSYILLVVAGMVGLAFASVPLYSLFCRVTGYGGTTMMADKLPEQVLERTVTVKFYTDTARNIDWNFKAEKNEEKVKLGQQGLIAFIAKNNGRTPTTGTALYNVTPAKAGKYFQKMQCFCFDEQTLKPGEEMHMPVVYFIDPKMNEDPDMEDVKTISLSYTFFSTDSKEYDEAFEAFTNSENTDK